MLAIYLLNTDLMRVRERKGTFAGSSETKGQHVVVKLVKMFKTETTVEP